MTSAQPAAARGRDPKASVLAALQLVEDARQLGTERGRHRQRARLAAEQTLASRRLARDIRAAG
jgi:hypothetical protein